MVHSWLYHGHLWTEIDQSGQTISILCNWSFYIYIYIYIHIYIHTHTHTHIHISITLGFSRNRERSHLFTAPFLLRQKLVGREYWGKKHCLRLWFESRLYMGFPCGPSGKESTCQCRRHKRCRFQPWAERSSGVGNGNPLQYSCLGNPMDRGAWWATVHGSKESWTWLSNLAQNFTYIHTQTQTHTYPRRLHTSDIFCWIFE